MSDVRDASASRSIATELGTAANRRVSLIGPALVAAGVSGAIAVMGFIVTTRTVRRLRADRLEFDFALSAHKFNLDKALAEIRAAADSHDHELSELRRTTELAEGAVAQFHQMKIPWGTTASPA